MKEKPLDLVALVTRALPGLYLGLPEVLESSSSMEAKAKSQPRTKPPEERRDELMNAAEALFLKQGVNGTTVEQITARAGLSKGAFYLHFATKGDIHGALGERFTRRYVEAVRAAIARRSPADWRGKLMTWAKASANGFLDEGKLIDILFHAHPHPPDGGRSDTVVEPIRTLLEAGVLAGAWTVKDPQFMAVFLYSAMHGVVDDALLKGKRVNRTALIRGLEDACLRAINLPE
ncbi:MAG: TetR/AcrR family transcriptional regulator [Parvibaculaceae bacterium]